MRALVLALHGALALACTQILVPSPTGEVVVANTVESGDYVAEHDGHSVHDAAGDRRGGNGRAAAPTPPAPARRRRGLRGVQRDVRLRRADERGGLFASHHMLKLSVYEERDAARPGSGVRATSTSGCSPRSARSPSCATRSRRPTGRAPSPTPTARTAAHHVPWGVVDAAGAAVVPEWVSGAAHNNWPSAC